MNYYEILEITPDVTQAEVKSAYRRLARKYHPDINKSPDAIGTFKLITVAYETLFDNQKRHQYDIIHGIFKTEQKETSIPKEDFQTQEPRQSTTEKKSTTQLHNDKYKQQKTNEKKSIFRAIKLFFIKFNKDKKRQEELKPQKGKNITTEITITPEEVITGSKRVVNILTTQTCPKCFGHKFVNGAKCQECLGHGEISIKKKITVTIPKGIKDGAKLRLKGEGGCGKNGAANGDLLISIKIETNTQIHYDKQNIYYNIPITPFEAALGEEIKIKTFDGVIKLKLPKNTSSGQKFRISNQGIKHNGKVGDLIITVNIEFSQNLTAEELNLYQRLKNLSTNDIRDNFVN